MARATDFCTARAGFLGALPLSNVVRDVYKHTTASGQEGEVLAVDAAWIGSPDSSRAVLIVSGTHGIEGVVGSKVQSAWLTRRQSSSVATLLVHALNPYGLSWSRRCDEHNVDVNRNFIDFSSQLPPNVAYAEKATIIAPNDWLGDAREKADAALMAWIADVGPRGVQHAITAGQYTHPNGLFYGGVEPSWSRLTFEAIFRRFLTNCSRIVVIDLHTGLGPYGSCQLIQKGGDPIRGGYIMGDVIQAGSVASVSSPVLGTLTEWATWGYPNIETFSFVAEFGTLPDLEVLAALRADNWLHAHGDLTAPYATEINDAMRAAFAPDDADWQSVVVERALDIISRAHMLASL